MEVVPLFSSDALTRAERKRVRTKKIASLALYSLSASHCPHYPPDWTFMLPSLAVSFLQEQSEEKGIEGVLASQPSSELLPAVFPVHALLCATRNHEIGSV